MKSLCSAALALCLIVTALPAFSTPSSYDGLAVTGIVLKDDRGNPWTKPEQIMPLIGLKPGDVYSGQAVRDGITLLYLKGLFRDIRVEAFEEQGGVRLEYTFLPVTVVDRIVVRGNHELSTTAVTGTMPNVTGKELREDKLPALGTDIIALYQAEGYFETTVSFRAEQLAEPHRVALHVYIVEGAPTTIGEISFTGNTVFNETALRGVMKSRAGSQFRRDLLLDRDKEAILEKYMDAGYPTAKAGPVDISFRDHKAYVRIVVSEGPRLAVRFTGNRALSASKLKQALLFSSEHDLSDAVIDSSADRIRSLYRERGYADVVVDVNKTAAPDGLDLDFSISEGQKLKVERIAFRGNTVFTAKEIKKQMALQGTGWFSWFTSPPFRQDLLDKDVDNILDRYLEAGYLAADVKSTVARSADGREAFVTIEIAEGPRTLTGAVALEGNTVLSSTELLDKMSLKPGDPFNERLVDEDRYRILTAYSNKGFLYARVDVDRTPRDRTMDLRYRITEDRQVRIGRIILRGNERTKDYVIMRELLVKPGDPYNYGDILASQQRIYHLGYIRLAKFEPIHPGEKEYVQDMLLTVEERPAGAMEFGLGYGDLDRLRGYVELSYRNLWGTAKYTSLRYEESDILKRAIFNFQEPWFLDRKLEAKFSLVWSDSERLNSDTREIYYKTRKTSASFGVEKSYEKLKPSLTYLFENVVNYQVKAAAQLTPEDSGRVLVSSLSPALILDLRDDVFNPRRGALYGIIVKEALREFFSEADFSKITVQASWFLPIDNAVAAFSARAGMAWPFRDTPEVPLHERFYVGGGTTVRGFTQDSIGPGSLDPNGDLIPQGGASMAVFNAELRLNPGEGLGFVLFADAGNVWPGQEINLNGLRASYGVGVRYGTPVGPLRLDYGQKIHRLPGETPGEVHFNISNTF
jgi:outer membrane protein insertion porin family